VWPTEAPASAPVAVNTPAGPSADLCAGEGWQQRRGQAALASLRSDATDGRFTVRFLPARSGYMGLTHTRRGLIEVFVRSCQAQSGELLRHVIAHELGHAYDAAHNSAQERSAWMRARGISASQSWAGCSGCSDFATPAGDFAEVYAQWARGATTNKSRVAGAPSPAELDLLAREFFAG
jgi:hypothetical protein